MANKASQLCVESVSMLECKEVERRSSQTPSANVLSPSNLSIVNEVENSRRHSNDSLMSNPFIGLMSVGNSPLIEEKSFNEVELKIIIENRDNITNQQHLSQANMATVLTTKPPAPTEGNGSRRLRANKSRQKGNLGGSNVFEHYQNSISERTSRNASVANIQIGNSTETRSTPNSPSRTRRVSWADDAAIPANRAAFERGSGTRKTWSVGKMASSSGISSVKGRSRSPESKRRFKGLKEEVNGQSVVEKPVSTERRGRSPSPTLGLSQSFRRLGRKWLGFNK